MLELFTVVFFLPDILPSGSLDNLDGRTPPRSLKIRTFSIAEQEEQEAASGTHDRRVSWHNMFIMHMCNVVLLSVTPESKPV